MLVGQAAIFAHEAAELAQLKTITESDRTALRRLADQLARLDPAFMPLMHIPMIQREYARTLQQHLDELHRIARNYA